MRNIPLTVRFIIQPKRQNLYEEFSQQVLSLQEDPESPINYQLPSTWIRSTENKLRFLVPYNSDEYTSMVNCFDQTMKGIYTSIIRIERIQNQRWFLQYQVHRQEFNKRLAIDTERLLYHGCSQSAANLIIEDCFNRSFAGAHGTTYGIGMYFSSDASYSDNFTEVNSNGERCMFVARVLVGNTTQGNRSIKTRPVGFDSTTDGKHIFVIYHDAQAYADYLITYK
ncbi:unnamed protein product [Rotaria sordida]|uniref:Poly [ADP-ribose] polymerase n=1 Tax=Rotaria sordida TaxID=392033 RepID=A0A813W415_9BILA|nr:unnamed protein product [Rotaria sordida]CAF0983937.1 unnamed protein product [Rotaria sordida]